MSPVARKLRDLVRGLSRDFETSSWRVDTLRKLDTNPRSLAQQQLLCWQGAAAATETKRQQQRRRRARLALAACAPAERWLGTASNRGDAGSRTPTPTHGALSLTLGANSPPRKVTPVGTAASAAAPAAPLETALLSAFSLPASAPAPAATAAALLHGLGLASPQVQTAVAASSDGAAAALAAARTCHVARGGTLLAESGQVVCVRQHYPLRRRWVCRGASAGAPPSSLPDRLGAAAPGGAHGGAGGRERASPVIADLYESVHRRLPTTLSACCPLTQHPPPTFRPKTCQQELCLLGSGPPVVGIRPCGQESRDELQAKTGCYHRH